DGRKWITSLFHPVLFSERVQQHLTVNKDNLQEEPLRAMKARCRNDWRNKTNRQFRNDVPRTITILSIQNPRFLANFERWFE
ncbi:MAG: hypothetical protein VXZ27_10400, partial [SAR324 cluster bacterium]|nr:hypothetical protein [SAR324 cluster bacterium]MEC8436214.1 hypothetical protein [SAR324 cluster bacterium]